MLPVSNKWFAFSNLDFLILILSLGLLIADRLISPLETLGLGEAYDVRVEFFLKIPYNLGLSWMFCWL